MDIPNDPWPPLIPHAVTLPAWLTRSEQSICPAQAISPGTTHQFAVNPDGFAAVQEFLAGFWAEHLGRLRATLTENQGPEPGQARD